MQNNSYSGIEEQRLVVGYGKESNKFVDQDGSTVTFGNKAIKEFQDIKVTAIYLDDLILIIKD